MGKLSAAAKEAEKYLRKLKNTKKVRDYNKQDPETMKEVLKGSRSKNYDSRSKLGDKRMKKLKMGEGYGTLKGGERVRTNKPKDMRARKEMSDAQLDKEIKLMDKDLTMDERAALLGGFKKGGKVKKGMKKGGKVSSCSKRGDGCAVRGKTKGRMI